MTDIATQGTGSGAPGGQHQAAPAARPQSAQDAKTAPTIPGAHDLGRDKLGASGFENQPQPQTPGQQPAPSAAEKIKVGDAEYEPAEFNRLAADVALEASRKATLPKSADEYQVTLPKDFQLPEGVKNFEFNKDDPGLKQLRELAHKRGWDQDTLSDTLGLYAANRIAEMTVINNARNAEIAKLGSAGPQRIDAVKTWAMAHVGNELAPALMQMLCTAKQVTAFEALMRSMSSQGGTSYSGNRREPPAEQGKIPGYDKMTFEQKRIAQMQQRGNMG